MGFFGTFFTLNLPRLQYSPEQDISLPKQSTIPFKNLLARPWDARQLQSCTPLLASGGLWVCAKQSADACEQQETARTIELGHHNQQRREAPPAELGAPILAQCMLLSTFEMPARMRCRRPAITKHPSAGSS